MLNPFPLGLSLIAVGGSVALYQGLMLWRERPDPYDLNRLWDAPPDEPEEDDGDERDLAYCHRCGASMPKAYGLCPGCGNTLGT